MKIQVILEHARKIYTLQYGVPLYELPEISFDSDLQYTPEEHSVLFGERAPYSEMEIDRKIEEGMIHIFV